jgi:hypothetical protein
MATGFIDKLPGGINIEHRPAETGFGGVDMNSPPKACGHTTETTGLPAYGDGQTNAPTFTIGEANVWQHRGLGQSCGTLRNVAGGAPETNRVMRVQFELVGFSTREPWLPKSTFQQEALAAVKDLAHDEFDVPRDHVWPDIQDDGILATESYHRRHSKFPNVPGWYGHVEIPDNDHWDWGSLRWNDLGAGPTMVVALAFVERFKNPQGNWRSREISPFFSDKAALRDWAITPDGANLDNDDELRLSLFQALFENRVFVAERRVPEDRLRA